LRPEILRALAEVFDSRSYIQGPYVEAFGRAFATAHGISYAAGCSNGTTALSLALECAGVGRGDEVITTPYTFVATVEAIVHLGAIPVFVDIEPSTYNIDPATVEAAITPRTRAILPVHVYGTPCAMDAIMSLAGRQGIPVIEDCAQAHLAAFNETPVGGFGVAGTFSFYPGKNLGACGDAGMVMSSDEKFIERVRMLLNHGQATRYTYDMVGYNRRMDAFQAAVLNVKLPYLSAWTKHRRALARLYDDHLVARGFKVIEASERAPSVYHLYVAEVENREQVAQALTKSQIGYAVHYPRPLHLQPAFGDLGYREGAFPVAERASRRIISLPMCGETSFASVNRVCEVLATVARP
jgi:dTDP-4-amino-4,6-dideoxygalactose transaminase